MIYGESRNPRYLAWDPVKCVITLFLSFAKMLIPFKIPSIVTVTLQQVAGLVSNEIQSVNNIKTKITAAKIMQNKLFSKNSHHQLLLCTWIGRVPRIADTPVNLFQSLCFCLFVWIFILFYKNWQHWTVHILIGCMLVIALFKKFMGSWQIWITKCTSYLHFYWLWWRWT